MPDKILRFCARRQSCQAAASARDPELQRALAYEALCGLDHLLTGQPAGDSIPTAQIAALVRLITQAAREGQAEGKP